MMLARCPGCLACGGRGACEADVDLLGWRNARAAPPAGRADAPRRLADGEVDVPTLARSVSVFAREEVKALLQKQYQAKNNLKVDLDAMLAEARAEVARCLPADPARFVDLFVQARLAQAAARHDAAGARADRAALTCPYCLAEVRDRPGHGEEAAGEEEEEEEEKGPARPRTLAEVTRDEREELECAACGNRSERCVLREHTKSDEKLRQQVRDIMTRDYMHRHHFGVLWTQAKRALLRAKPRPHNPYAFLAAFFRRFDRQIAVHAADVLGDALERRRAAAAEAKAGTDAAAAVAAAAAAAVAAECAAAGVRFYGQPKAKSKLDHLVDAIASALGDERPPDEDRVFHKVTPLRWKTAGEINDAYVRRHHLDAWWREHAAVALRREMPANPFLFLAARLDITSGHYVRRIEAAYERRRERQRELDARAALFPPRALREQPAAVALARELAAAARPGRPPADLDALVAASLRTQLGVVRAHQAMGLLEYLPLLALRATPSVRGSEALADAVSPAALDRAARRADDRLRVLFVRDRDSCDEVRDPAAGCVDVFARRDEVMRCEARPEGLATLCDWRDEAPGDRVPPRLPPRPAAGAHSCVDRATFLRRFRKFHGGALDGLDWSNTCAAGGAVMAALQPGASMDDPLEFTAATAAGREYDGSDLDLFLYGLTPAEANNRVRRLDAFLRDSGRRRVAAALDPHMPPVLADIVQQYVPHPRRDRRMSAHGLLVVRTASAVTWTLDYPLRHVQVVLRLYASPAEVVLGFDVDSCSVAWDGRRVLATPRAVRALNRGYNLVDLSRRSYTYETRLLKYSLRGFAVAVEGFDRSRVDPAVETKKFSAVRGLARLVALEARQRDEFEDEAERADDDEEEEDGEGADGDGGGDGGGRGGGAAPVKNLAVTEERAGEPVRQTGWAERSWQAVAGAGVGLYRSLAAAGADPEQEVRRAAFEAESAPTKAAEYASVFLPRSPYVDNMAVFRCLVARYLALNAQSERRNQRRCPCFFYWGVDEIFEDRWHVNGGGHAPRRAGGGGSDDTFVVGPLEWLEVNPGRQTVGSFYPITTTNWFSGAYLPAARGGDGPAERAYDLDVSHAFVHDELDDEEEDEDDDDDDDCYATSSRPVGESLLRSLVDLTLDSASDVSGDLEADLGDDGGVDDDAKDDGGEDEEGKEEYADDPFAAAAFAAGPGSWKCVLCDMPNSGGDATCTLCGTRGHHTYLNLAVGVVDTASFDTSPEAPAAAAAADAAAAPPPRKKRH